MTITIFYELSFSAVAIRPFRMLISTGNNMATVQTGSAGNADYRTVRDKIPKPIPTFSGSPIRSVDTTRTLVDFAQYRKQYVDYLNQKYW